MKLLEFQDKHAGDLTGPALEEIKSRHQALQLQHTAPPTTGVRPNVTQNCALVCLNCSNKVQLA